MGSDWIKISVLEMEDWKINLQVVSSQRLIFSFRFWVWLDWMKKPAVSMKTSVRDLYRRLMAQEARFLACLCDIGKPGDYLLTLCCFPFHLKKLGARRFIFNIPCVLSRWRKLIEATLQGRSSICVPLRSIYCSAKSTIWKLFSEVSVKYQDLTFTFKFLPSVVPLFQIVETLMIFSWETKWPKKGQHRFQLIFWRIQCHIPFFRQTYVQGVISTPYSQADFLITFYRTLSVFCPSGFWVISHLDVVYPLESST